MSYSARLALLVAGETLALLLIARAPSPLAATAAPLLALAAALAPAIVSRHHDDEDVDVDIDDDVRAVLPLAGALLLLVAAPLADALTGPRPPAHTPALVTRAVRLAAFAFAIFTPLGALATAARVANAALGQRAAAALSLGLVSGACGYHYFSFPRSSFFCTLLMLTVP